MWEPVARGSASYYTLIPHRPDHKPLDFDRLVINAAGVTLPTQLVEAKANFTTDVSRVVIDGVEYSGQRILVVLELLVGIVDDGSIMMFPARSVSTFNFE